MRPVGAHVTLGGGLQRAFERAAARGCDAVQIFPSNPRAWVLPRPDPAADERAAAELEERGWLLLLHSPYLVNLATPDLELVQHSVRSLAFALDRGARMGALAVVVHAGHCRGRDRDEALAQVVEATKVLLDRVDGPALAFEPTAGGDGAVAARPEELLELVEAFDHHPRVKVVPDTCHLFAAGVDYRDPATLAEARRTYAEIGPERIAAVHLNDSKDPCGSRRDRHEHLGEGTIGLAALEELVNCPELAHAPLFVETGPPPDAQARDVEIARSFSARAGSALPASRSRPAARPS